MKNITDEQLQAYLDGDPSINRREFDQRLRNDPKALQQLNVYRSLFQQLGSGDGFMLSADFADRVLRQARGADAAERDYGETWLLVLTILVSLASLAYFVFPDFRMPEMWAGFTGGLGNYVSFIKVSMGRFHLYVATAVILISMALLDRVLLQMRRH